MIDRERLRKKIKECRRKMAAEDIRTRSCTLCEKLESVTILQKTQVIMAYAPVRGEADLSLFWLKRWREGAVVLLPRVEGNELVPVAFTGWDNMVSGPFGIREPSGQPWPVDSIEAVIVPGLVFDLKGYRLGHGKGYYDRFLSRLGSRVLRLGVGFECQVVESVFPQPHDSRLDLLVTDARIRWFAKDDNR